MIENFDKLEYNRKVDVLVAIYVMGFSYNSITIKEMKWNDTRLYWSVYRTEQPGLYTDIPLYSILLTSAWDMVRKFEYLYLYHNKKFVKGNGWYCSLVVGEENYMYAETEMLAICYAGLKAVAYPLQSFLKEEGKV